MTKFWTITVAGMYNTLTERFYTYEQAKNEAIKRAQKAPNLTFLVLELKGYAQGNSVVEVDYEDSLEITHVVVVRDDGAGNITLNLKNEPTTYSDGNAELNINVTIDDDNGNIYLNKGL